MPNLEEIEKSKKAFGLECAKDAKIRLFKVIRWISLVLAVLATVYAFDLWTYLMSAALAVLWWVSNVFLIDRRKKIKDTYYYL